MSAGAGRERRPVPPPYLREHRLQKASIWGPGSKIYINENLGSGQNHRRYKEAFYHCVSLESNLSIGSFCAQSGKSHLSIRLFCAQIPLSVDGIWGSSAKFSPMKTKDLADTDIDCGWRATSDDANFRPDPTFTRASQR